MRISPISNGLWPFLRPRFILATAGLTAIIVYGSLYPFDFCPIDYPGGPVRALLSTWPERTTFGDLLANILLYLPLGFCAVQSFRAARWLRAAAAITLGIALSGSMELLQLYDQGRWATMSDVRSNALGALLGTIAGLVTEPMWRRLPRFVVHAEPFVVILLACWAGYRLFPYAPVIDLHKYWHAVQPLLKPQLSAVALCRYTVCWLVIALMLEQLFGAAVARPALLLAVAAILCARILIDQAALSTSDVAGGILATLLWSVCLSRTAARVQWICGLFVLSLLVQGLNPFHFSARSHGYVWIPFYGLLEGEPQIAIPSFFEKAFNYGTLLWLLGRAGLGRAAAIAACSALVMVLSLVHSYMPERTAEVTDLALLLSMALVMRLTRDLAAPTAG